MRIGLTGLQSASMLISGQDNGNPLQHYSTLTSITLEGLYSASNHVNNTIGQCPIDFASDCFVGGIHCHELIPVPVMFNCSEDGRATPLATNRTGLTDDWRFDLISGVGSDVSANVSMLKYASSVPDRSSVEYL